MGRTFVVSIGVNSAPHSDLADLRFARADAEAIAGALSHPDRGVAASGNWQCIVDDEAAGLEMLDVIERPSGANATIC